MTTLIIAVGIIAASSIATVRLGGGIHADYERKRNAEQLVRALWLSDRNCVAAVDDCDYDGSLDDLRDRIGVPVNFADGFGDGWDIIIGRGFRRAQILSEIVIVIPESRVADLAVMERWSRPLANSTSSAGDGAYRIVLHRPPVRATTARQNALAGWLAEPVAAE